MIGQTIGTYRIEQKIGEGGMGAVYRGHDLMLEREVAIKALRPELARQPELVARFRSEAVTLAKLNHSHIATLYNFLRQGDDFFMVMEFVRGETLDQIITQHGALEIEDAVRWFCQALEGIAHAHALGVIHRDIKPANVMLTENGDVKVMDFGIARVLGTARQTKTGRLIGTLEYMAPEQMRGQETDARADIYSLGILLYEMVTGRVPFACDSDYELMRRQVEDQPPAPREFKGDIPLAVELAIMRALAKDPAARFQSAADFRAALISAVPAAAIKREPPRPVQELVIKATRQAASFSDFNIGAAPQAVAGGWPAAPAPPVRKSRSSFDANTGAFTLQLPSFILTARQQLESRLGPLGWKHYAAAAAAVLALVAGLFVLRGGDEKSAPIKRDDFVVAPSPVPTAAPPEIEPLPQPSVAPGEQPVEPAAPAKVNRAAVTKPRPQPTQVAYDNRVPPPAPRVEQPRPQPTPYQPPPSYQRPTPQGGQQQSPTLSGRIPGTDIRVNIPIPWGGKKKDEKKKDKKDDQ